MSAERRPEWSKELRIAREEMGLSRSAAAKLAGVSAETIKGYELGR
ncbi:MAG: helix-turn-helix domain-containing protein, partial [Dehalococcoidia bacterium]